MLSALAIALRQPREHSAGSLLHEGPDASLGKALARQIALRALTTGGGATGAWLVARSTGTRRRASTVGLAALVGTQLGQTAVVGGRSPIVLGSMLLSAGVLVAIVQTPGVSQFFGCTPLGPVGWGIATGATVAATGTSVLAPWTARRLGSSSSERSGGIGHFSFNVLDAFRTHRYGGQPKVGLARDSRWPYAVHFRGRQMILLNGH
ncbi:MAG: cation transporting ATPase C-terminal domain-containing protein [Acidimicrobiales bacterium]